MRQGPVARNPWICFYGGPTARWRSRPRVSKLRWKVPLGALVGRTQTFPGQPRPLAFGRPTRRDRQGPAHWTRLETWPTAFRASVVPGNQLPRPWGITNDPKLTGLQHVIIGSKSSSRPTHSVVKQNGSRSWFRPSPMTACLPMALKQRSNADPMTRLPCTSGRTYRGSW